MERRRYKIRDRSEGTVAAERVRELGPPPQPDSDSEAVKYWAPTGVGTGSACHQNSSSSYMVVVGQALPPARMLHSISRLRLGRLVLHFAGLER